MCTFYFVLSIRVRIYKYELCVTFYVKTKQLPNVVPCIKFLALGTLQVKILYEKLRPLYKQVRSHNVI